MRASVDENECIGCGLCAVSCPAVFSMDGGIAKVLILELPSDMEESCREASENCPVDAIATEE